MSLHELTDRSRQEAAKWADRVAPGRWTIGPDELFASRAPALSGGGTALRTVRERLPERFFAGVETGAAVDTLRDRIPNSRCAIVRLASEISARRFTLFSHEGLELGERIDWHVDCVGGVRAPQSHWSRIEPLNPAMVGDSKITWELNRHQWLVTLAQASWLTEDARYAQEAADLLHDWARSNPYGVGINWASSLEVSYRLIAWCWSIALLRESGVCTDRECAGVLALIWRHARHVERYLSRYFSPNTHLTGEALGLFYAGVLFPEFEDAARWRDLGRRILVEESRRQILSDGVYFEQATCYQRYTIEIYLHFLILAERNGIDVPAEIGERVQRMLDVFLLLGDRDGTMPQIGDADGGWLVPLAVREPHDCRGVFAVAAALFDRPDFAWAAGGLAPEVVWLLGSNGVRRFDDITPHPPRAAASRLLEEGGYAVMRNGWTRDAHQLIVDVGPLGSGAHGHADLLSVQCQAFGESHLVDPGTYCYTPEPEWRNYFRSSAAHSTVVVDGRSQVEPRGPFGWSGRRPAARVRAWQSTGELDFLDAEHDAYADLSDPVVHRRRVLFAKPDYWVIVDDLSGREAHRLDLRFQFGASAVRMGSGLWASSAGPRGTGLWMAPFASVPISAALRQGALDPIEGWVSSDYGRRQPAPVVVYSTTAALPIRIITLLVPVASLGPEPPRVAAVHHADGRLAGIRFVETGDSIVVDDETISARRAGIGPVTAVAGGV